MKIIYENDKGGVSQLWPRDKSYIKFIFLNVIFKSDSEELKKDKEKKIKAENYILKIAKTRPITEEEWLTFIAMDAVPDGVVYNIVDESVIPSDRYFRNAWKKNGAKIEIDIPKARVIHMDRIRNIRDRELKKSDVQKMVEEEQKGKLSQTLKTKRQMLRDLPQTFDLSVYKTPETLKAAWPDDLPRE